MTAAEYCKLIDRLGYTYARAAAELGISERTHGYYRAGGVPIAPPVAKLLRMLAELRAEDAARKD